MNGPYFDLGAVSRLADDETTVALTYDAIGDAESLGYEPVDIREILRDLHAFGAIFYKSMESAQRPGTFFDVYHVPLGNRMVYLKFTIGTRRRPPREHCIVVTSFKER